MILIIINSKLWYTFDLLTWKDWSTFHYRGAYIMTIMESSIYPQVCLHHNWRQFKLLWHRLPVGREEKKSKIKERYRIGKKQKSWRSQIYIKLTRSNDDSRKHPLKYFCLKFHTRWEINNPIFAFGVYRSVSVLFIFVLPLIQWKICYRFFTILSWPRWSIDLEGLLV